VDEQPIILDTEEFHNPKGWREHPRKRERNASLRFSQAPGGAPMHEREEDAQDHDKHLFRERWAEMLLTQPPIKSVSIRDTQRGDDRGAVRVTAADGEGIRLGDLLKAAAGFYSHCGRPAGFKFDAEMEVYHRVDIDMSKYRDRTPITYVSRGRSVPALEVEDFEFLRAWKVKLKCNLG